MKAISTLLLALILLSPAAWARDDRLKFPVYPFLDGPDAKAKLTGNVRFFFGEQSFPEPVQTYGQFNTNKKTNAFGKSDEKACQWAFLSAMLSLHDRALREGGNAVVNIRSNYKSVEFVSDSEFECGAGGMIAGVALIGTVVKLPE